MDARGMIMCFQQVKFTCVYIFYVTLVDSHSGLVFLHYVIFEEGEISTFRTSWFVWVSDDKSCCFALFELLTVFREWLTDCCLMATQQFSAISWWEQVNFQWDDDDEDLFVLDQHT